ncbi:hypothetical protein IEQ34_021110 [Dendrobium chrysotoxum]|uniref:GATA-type domain-containing protein n=1 Tax=Dendrobium chrysotoxum TaxID=161865 RepID=A0AAV7G401_DENCH|nr:hypothetical protein IEQ34_021110 [Dendrobium chrysotoxum]
MEVYGKAKVPGEVPTDFQSEMLSSPAGAIWEDFIPGQNMEGDEEDNISLQWLSIFMEDCFSSTTSFNFPTPLIPTKTNNASNTCATDPYPAPLRNPNPCSFKKPSFPAKARNKRRKTKTSSQFINSSIDSPLLHQKHWLAESELLISPKMEKDENKPETEDEEKGINGRGVQHQQPRRCSHCLSQRTPQWRTGPLGPKTLCNACGVRFKSGRLLPEYRPVKSPTFVNYKHSNSHKKVMEMRMADFSTNSN